MGQDLRDSRLTCFYISRLIIFCEGKKNDPEVCGLILSCFTADTRAAYILGSLSPREIAEAAESGCP